jgi:large conductance mechanosensitive channel
MENQTIKEKKIGFWKELLEFFKEYKVVGLALAFIMGVASTLLVKSLVENIIMPFVTPIIPEESWKNASLSLGPVIIKWGVFLSELISFLILAIVVFFIAKKIMKEEKVSKR